MKGILLLLALFFTICYSTDVYLTAYNTPGCVAASGYVVLKYTLTSSSCSNGLLLNGDGSVSVFSSTNCSGNATFSVASGGACTNGTFSNYQSLSQMVPSGVYIQTDLYQNSNCSTSTYPFNTYLPNGTNCVPAGTSSSASYAATSPPNVTLNYYPTSTSCSGTPLSSSFPPGCNNVNSVFIYLAIQNLPPPTTTGASVTGSSVTGSSVTGSSVTGSSVTGSSVTGSSTTGASGSTTGSSSSNDSNMFYPSLFLLVSLFLVSLF